MLNCPGVCEVWDIWYTIYIGLTVISSIHIVPSVKVGTIRERKQIKKKYLQQSRASDLAVKMFLYVMFLCGFLVVGDSLILKDICTTPDSKEGYCINLQECPSIYAMSTDFDNPLTIDRLNFLIESQCGYLGNNPKVCCPAAEVLQRNAIQDEVING
ncbi:hypothetical protein JTB14_037076 [Gonioctena quinquepunctata]|nr:hypothetical protein JTB14_037076 [Gonioctena quinquepunctata]